MSVRRVVVCATALAGMAVVAGFVRAPRTREATTVVRGLPYYADRSLTPFWPASRSELNGLHRIGDFHLVASDGRAITGADVAGRVYVASFFFTECRTLCPDLKVQLARVRDAFAGDTSVLIVSHSVMPERDNPARLAHYAVRNGVDGVQWRLVTGDRAELTRLARESYFVEISDTTGNTRGQLRHTETLVLVDGRGRIRGVYDGSLAYDVTQLIADVRQLKGEEGGRLAR